MANLSPYSTPYVYALITSIVSGILYFALNIADIGLDLFEPLLAGLAAASLASYITTALINRTFQEQEQDRQDRMKKTGYQVLKSPLERHIRLLIEMYIATSQKYPEDLPTDHSSFFDRDFAEQIQHLNLREDYPIIRGRMTWGTYVGDEIKDFQDDIDEILKLYSPWFHPEMVELLQDIRNSPIFETIVRISNVLEFREDELGEDLFDILWQGKTDDISTHLDLLNKIIREYDDYEDLEMGKINRFQIWQETIAPSLGCGWSKIETLHPPDGQWIPLYREDTNTRLWKSRDKLDEPYGDR